jgi:hypothetical protein
VTFYTEHLHTEGKDLFHNVTRPVVDIAIEMLLLKTLFLTAGGPTDPFIFEHK